ncbi:DUF4194 domain-containing protein [Pseudactinotalea sp. Z1748]|uniref:DUF4194 domain-containing protein n=1 Tax=Pseudactinotalea sp. Z1748 TaxID=3413027 RepID=UPI003C7E4E85
MTDTDTDTDAAAPSPLWEGDTGALREVSRRTLVQLLRGPYLSARRHPQLWTALLADEHPIRSRLADLFLDLIIDTEAEVAFVRNADPEEVEAPRVVRSASMTFLDTAMVLHLRQQLLQAGSGERVIVGSDEIADQLQVYRGRDDADPAMFAKRINSSRRKLIDYGILARTSTEGRYEISPVLRLVFGAEEIAAVQAEFDRLAGAQDGADDGAAPVAQTPPERPTPTEKDDDGAAAEAEDSPQEELT